MIVLAHPGRADSNGCHTCRTNCPAYGLSYGEYHCSGSTITPIPSNSFLPPVTDKKPDPVVAPKVVAPVRTLQDNSDMWFGLLVWAIVISGIIYFWRRTKS